MGLRSTACVVKQFFAKLFWIFVTAAKAITMPIDKENKNEY